MTATVHEAIGYRADWLNAWLAAIGITVAVDGLRLFWSNDPIPYARFEPTGGDLPAIVFQQLPTVEQLATQPIARHLDERAEFRRKVTLDAYRDRATQERVAAEPSLSLTVTDLFAPRTAGASETDLPHSAFDVPVPKGLTLWQRVVSCREAITGPDMVSQSLKGPGPRIKGNGLGFDITRLPSRSDGGNNLVDPVLELLAFLGLTLFPVRGNGRTSATRGWRNRPTRHGAFRWSTWTQPRDRWAIDAWLDRCHADGHPDQQLAFQTVPYTPVSASDTTRGYASEPAR